MKFISRLRDKDLFIAWGGLFVLTALLGLLFPGAEGLGQGLLLCAAVCFFIPPWLILIRAKQSGRKRNVVIIRLLSLASLGATLVLFCAGILSLPLGGEAGELIHILMTVLCAPVTCGDYYALPMFLWATLLVGSFGKKK